MATDDQLFAVEDALSAALEAAMDPIVAAYKQRDASDLTTVYGTVQVTVSGVTGHLGVTGAGDSIHDRWNCNVTLSVVTNRRENAGQHGSVLARLRGILARSWQHVPEMLHHEIWTCVEGGSSVQYDPDTDQDVTQITATMNVGIKPASLL